MKLKNFQIRLLQGKNMTVNLNFLNDTVVYTVLKLVNSFIFIVRTGAYIIFN